MTASCKFLGAGNDSSSSSSGCAPAPTGNMTVAGNCPSSLGTWDKYDIVKDAQGNTVSINKYCDAADVEVAHNQSDMDAVATTAGGVSNNDFQGTSTCSSGSFTKNGQTYQGIWYKQ